MEAVNAAPAKTFSRDRKGECSPAARASAGRPAGCDLSRRSHNPRQRFLDECAGNLTESFPDRGCRAWFAEALETILSTVPPGEFMCRVMRCPSHVSLR